MTNYNGNADIQINRYNQAIKYINSAIDNIDTASIYMKKIDGFPVAEELKNAILNKKTELQNKIIQINTQKKVIYNKSRELTRKEYEAALAAKNQTEINQNQ